MKKGMMMERMTYIIIHYGSRQSLEPAGHNINFQKYLQSMYQHIFRRQSY